MQRFGILAYPAGHSLSPAMHNAAFSKLGIDAKYDFFEVAPENLKGFMEQVRAKKISGLSVSIPHKIEIMKYLDQVEESAKKIGAVNTIFWENQNLVGTNTDWFGAVDSLETSTNLAGKKVIILGGGGAARAIVFGLLEKKAEIIILTREKWESESIEKDFEIKTGLIKDISNYSCDIIINATPLGMKGELEGKSAVPLEFLVNQQPLVFDIVYNPAETKLLLDAQKAGCETIKGLGMLVRQGVKQFEIWTKQKAPLEKMFEAAEKNL